MGYIPLSGTCIIQRKQAANLLWIIVGVVVGIFIVVVIIIIIIYCRNKKARFKTVKANNK